MPAPITLFVYNRPQHTRQTLSALQKNELAAESELFIFSDAPKKRADKENVAQVRQLIKNYKGFKRIEIIEREQNLGLAANITDAVTKIVNQYGRIIVLEDDIVTSPAFLQFMNQALDLYAQEEKVMHISGYFPPVKAKLPPTFFYNQTSCWGWATWARAWQHYNPDTQYLTDMILKQARNFEFDIEGTYPFMSHLWANIHGEINTWAIKWHASVFLKKGLSLHPAISYVQNIGFDNSGEHCDTDNKYYIEKLNKKVNLQKNALKENRKARRAIRVFNLGHKPDFWHLFHGKIRENLKKMWHKWK